MTEQNSLPPDDHELEQFLARRSELSRRYRAGAEGEGTPPELDAPVLAQARAELRRPLARGRRLPRWSAPLAVAASLVLVVSLAWMAQQQPLPRAAAPAAAPLPAPPAANGGIVTESMAVQSSVPAAAKAETLEQLKKTSPALAMAAPGQERAARKPLPPSQDKREAKAVAAQGPSAVATVEAASAAPTRSVAAAAPAPAPPAPVVSNTGAAPMSFASVPPPQMAVSPVAPAASRAVVSNPCTSPQDAVALRQAQTGGDTDPAAWLERIRRLRDAPDPVAARAELACFSYIHSPQQVPDDLKLLLQAAP